ncbi:MAG: Uncharacterized protein AWU57_582 [Marinobacter sp. T13-3]|nr:MAG: Uncharacterized protein AWU57_582 [Marinobacter sp. T13-3]
MANPNTFEDDNPGLDKSGPEWKLARWLRWGNIHALSDLGERLPTPIMGATTLRFLSHALGDLGDDWAITCALRRDSNAPAPLLLHTPSGEALAFPGAWVVAAPASVAADPRAALEHLPSADPELFQGLMEYAARDEAFQALYQSRHGHPVPSERPDASWFDGSRPLTEIRQAMDWFYGSDEALGVTLDPDTGESVLPNGESFGCCTNSAHLMAERFGGSVSGFMVDDNPAATDHTIDQAGGHDFAVVNDRYIVDLWIGVYTGSTGADGKVRPAVYDRQSTDPQEQATVRALYGDPACWTELERYPTPTMESTPMPSITLDLTPYEVAMEGENHLTIKDCGGSVLANLNNDPAVTGDRFSEDWDRIVAETADGDLREYKVSYDQDTDNGAECTFTPADGNAPVLDEVADWISQNYDRMESIGAETLLSDDEVENVFRRHAELSGPSL